MRALVTGAGGFVGTYLVDALASKGDEAAVADRGRDGMLPLDLGDPENLRGLVELTRPDAIYHLAAQAFVPDAIADPVATFEVNTRGTLNLLEAVRAVRGSARIDPVILVVSSSDVYGVREPHEYPLHETAEPRPPNPYAASKVAAEAFALAACQTYGLRTIVSRAFNHIGPGQSERFAIASFAAQLARIAAGASPVLQTGNLAARRDFLDVRDVVSAYIALVERGKPGEIYNVASGEPREIREMLRALIEIAHVPVEVREESGRLREADVPVAYGDATKLRAATGWAPAVPLRQTLRETYERARETVAP